MNKVSFVLLGLFWISTVSAQNAVEIGEFASTPPTILEGSVCDSMEYIRNDDGSAENGYAGNPATVIEFSVVDQFDSADFPNSIISDVCVGLIASPTPASLTFEVVVFDDDGAGGAPGTELGSSGSFSTPMPIPPGLPGTVINVPLPGAGIQVPASGNFYVGVRFAPPGGIFISADETGATAAGAGFVLFDTGDPADDWEAMGTPTTFENYSAMLIRALPGEVVLPETQAVPVNNFWAMTILVLMLSGLGVFVIRRMA